PTNGIFTVVSLLPGEITVYSVEGKIVLNRVKMNATQQVFDLIGVERGVYFVKFSNGNAEKTIRLIRQ
ncbi:MAG TPA: T9SS type A sorting domain-containing protein, partial [Flavobacteriales bacterium]|nr:T9SS type A sorting domain-containing protein [Flavobacteriales bacterium]